MDLRPAADLWRNTLARIPTIFGRLQYLASLRDQNTGWYQHFGLAQRFTEELANQTLRESHLTIFGEWLCLYLEQQKADLELYLNSLEGDKKAILTSWMSLDFSRNCIPADAREVERTLFLSDLKTLLELFRYEYGVVLPDPDA